MERLVPKTDKISNIFNSSHWPLDLSPSPRCWVFVLGCLSRHKAHASSKCAFHQSHRCPEVLKQERERSEKNPKGTKMIGHGDVRAKVSRSQVRIRGVTHTNLDSTDETDESSSLSAKPFIIASVAGFDWMSLILANKPITSDSFAILCEDVLRHRSKVGVTQKPMWPNFLPPSGHNAGIEVLFLMQTPQLHVSFMPSLWTIQLRPAGTRPKTKICGQNRVKCPGCLFYETGSDVMPELNGRKKYLYIPRFMVRRSVTIVIGGLRTITTHPRQQLQMSVGVFPLCVRWDVRVTGT